MITSAITSKYKKANNNMEKQLKIHGKRILEKKSVSKPIWNKSRQQYL